MRRGWWWIVRDDVKRGPYRDAIEASEAMRDLGLWAYDRDAGSDSTRGGWSIVQDCDSAPHWARVGPDRGSE